MDGVILMGPFGSGKTHLGHALHAARIAEYVELEPIIYDRFGDGADFDVAAATPFLRSHYHRRLESPNVPQAFESTGVTQRPLVLEVQASYRVALVRVQTPKSVCLERVAARDHSGNQTARIENASLFFDFWTEEVAPSFDFSLVVAGTDEASAVAAVARLL